jgi:hypothetical protein
VEVQVQVLILDKGNYTYSDFYSHFYKPSIRFIENNLDSLIVSMSSISLEAFDANLRGRISQWILPSEETCSLPNGFFDQLISGSASFQTSILVLSKQDSKAWHLAYPWEMTFVPESTTDWSLLLSMLQHLKGPILIVMSPKIQVPQAFWQKCMAFPSGKAPTCVSLKYSSDSNPGTLLAHSIFFPKLDLITDTQFIKIPSSFPIAVQQSIKDLDLRSIYRELRGSGASLCLSLTESRFSVPSTIVSYGTNQQNGSIPSYVATWFYPEINSALRLHLSDLRTILRTVTERLAE